MKLIPLTQGYFAKVDDEDYEYLNQWKWQVTSGYGKNTRYALRSQRIGINKRVGVTMHRVILNLTDPSIQTDHRDRDGLNNQKSNLRTCNQSQNLANRKVFKSNKAGFRGVHYRKDRRKWKALLTHNGKDYHLGLFDTKELAGKAYLEKSKEIHGEFAPEY